MLFMGSKGQRNERNLRSGQTASVCGAFLFGGSARGKSPWVAFLCHCYCALKTVEGCSRPRGKDVFLSWAASPSPGQPR